MQHRREEPTIRLGATDGPQREKRLRKAESCKEQWREDAALRLVLL